MVEKIIVAPGNVRCYGNIVNPKSAEDFEGYRSSIIESTSIINNVAMTVYNMNYSLYGFGFGFDDVNKRLYVLSDEGFITGFSFDDVNKRLVLSSDSSDVSVFEFDEVKKALHIRID